MMASGKMKLLLAFAVLGFLIGSAAYLIFDWLALATDGMKLAPILAMVSTPWFLSGIAGSLLLIVAVYASAHFADNR
jgi:hypothetical protein